MRRIAIAAAAATLSLCAGAYAARESVQLPTGWRIATHDGPTAIVGTLPSGIVVAPDGATVVELETGYRKPMLRVLDAATLGERRSVPLRGAWGAPLLDPDGAGAWVAAPTTFQEALTHVDLRSGNADRAVTLPLPWGGTSVTRSPRGLLAVTGEFANAVAFVDPERERVLGTVTLGRTPAASAFSADGTTLFVALRGASDVAVVDVRRRARTGVIATGLHPSALASDGRFVYVAETDDDGVAVIDATTRRVVQRVAIPWSDGVAVGASPNGLALAGGRLYVTCGAANGLAVYAVGGDGRLRALGALPTGWYPTAVAVDAARHVLYVADGKGESGHANPKYRPDARAQSGEGARDGYVANDLTGSIRRVAIPSDAELREGLQTVRDLAEHEAAPASTVVRTHGPIAHVIYVIKENRTYDQVLGDVAGADGDPQLVLFGSAVTPNQHALVARFGVFDRFFEDAHVSADGHNWATAAIANDYTEHAWPASYGNRRPFYDFEDGAVAARPHNGYLWDDAAAHGVTLRNYGEYVTAPAVGRTPVTAADPVLRRDTDRNFVSFDMAYADVDRFAEWKREFDGYVAHGDLPALEIVRFPNDHTDGTRPGSRTPQAFVADNDLAVGKLVDAVSHSRFWASTAIFVLEDDAQNGPDHVAAQRSTFYLASPYAAGGVQHAHYTQASVLRTIELLLGLPPMTPYDAGARPLTAAFTDRADLRPFEAASPGVDLQAINAPSAYRAGDSARLDLAHADGADEATLNDILWHAVRGARATPPPYGMFAR